MHKSLAFCAVFLAFFISTGVVAKTTKAHAAVATKTHTKVVHLNKKVTNNTLQATEVKSVNASPATPVATAQSPYRDYVDHLTLPQSTKDLLYAYAATQEGQHALSRIINPSLVGPTGSSIASPIAFAADWGVVSAGLTYVNRWPGTGRRDGFAGASIGFGDAEKYVGLAVSVLADSLGIDSDYFAENGTVAAQLFHIFPNDWALAVGAGNIVPWGAFKDSSKDYYVVGSKVFGVAINNRSMPLTVSLGAGTGAFYSVSDSLEKHDNNIRPFGSAGWQIFPQVSVIGEWAAKQGNVGLSIVPIAQWPIMLTVADCNITRNESKNSYFLASIAAGYSF